MQIQRPVLITEQRQKLNPRMLQSIKILALPVAELTEEIQAELEANPALEVLADRSELSLDYYAEEEKNSPAEAWDDEPADFEYRASGSNDEDSKHRFLEGAISLPETLQEHLLSQLGMIPLNDQKRELGERLIQNLNEDGFTVSSPEELCPSCSKSILDEAISIIQHLDPLGTCTANYRESLIVQAKMNPDLPPGTLETLTEHFETLEKGKYADIRRALQMKEHQFQAVLDFIRTLSPFPGRLYSTEKTRYVIPDLAIRIEGSEFIIELNDEIIPVLGINPFFSDLSTKRKEHKEAAVFVRENIEKAKFFISSIQQRNQTLLKVAKALIKYQRSFFVDGPRGMQPLTLKDIAEDIGVHETTVSRIANGKYVQTEWGIFELRRFFTNAVASTASSTAQHSKESVKATLREVFELEKDKALSDRELVDILARRGIQIARRTVAKYRGELAMDSSFNRRKH